MDLVDHSRASACFASALEGSDWRHRPKLLKIQGGAHGDATHDAATTIHSTSMTQATPVRV